MTVLLTGYLVGLVYLAINSDKIASKDMFRVAWIFFSLIPVSHCVFTLFRAGNIGRARSLALVEIWADGFAWLFLAISLFCLLGALLPEEKHFNDK